MSRFSVDADRLQNASDQIGRLSGRVREAGQDCARIQNSLEWDVKGEQQLDRKFTILLAEINSISEQLKKAGVWLGQIKEEYLACVTQSKQFVDQLPVDVAGSNGHTGETDTNPGTDAKPADKTPPVEVPPKEVTPKGDGSKKVLTIAENLIFGNEGNYGSVNKNDENSAGNGSISIGKVQWRAERAHALLNNILKEFDIDRKKLSKEDFIEKALVYLPSEKICADLYDDASVWAPRKSWDDYITKEDSAAITKILSTAEGKAVQDNTAHNDIANYIASGKNLGITDEKVLIYYADMYNQGPAAANRVVKAAGGGAGLTLEKIHEAAINDKTFGSGSHEKRRIKDYDYLKGLDL